MERPAVAGKKKKVKILTEKLEKAVSFYIVDFTGLDANEMNSLRGRFRKSNYEYFVTKNSILKLASDNLGFEEISKVLTGPNAISISYEDPIGPARIIMDFSKESKLPTVKLCFIEGKWFTSDDVKKIADLPSRDVIIGQFLNLLNSPISLFVTLLRNILGNLVRVVDEIGKQKKASEEKPEKKAEEAKDEKQEDKAKEGEKEEVVEGTEKVQQVEEAKEEKQVDEPKEDGKLIEEAKDEKQEDKIKEGKKDEVVEGTAKKQQVEEAKEKKRTDVVKELMEEKQVKEVKKRKKSKETKKTNKKY
jgi:large subunit ribosomal protein L10